MTYIHSLHESTILPSYLLPKMKTDRIVLSLVFSKANASLNAELKRQVPFGGSFFGWRPRAGCSRCVQHVLNYQAYFKIGVIKYHFNM